MSSIKATLSTAQLYSRQASAGSGRNSLLGTIESLVGPASLVASLWIVVYVLEGQMRPPYLLLSCLVFALTFPGTRHLQRSRTSLVLDVLLGWLWVAGLLLATGIATGYLQSFSLRVLAIWLVVAPLAEFMGCIAMRNAAPALLKLQGPKRRAVIVGMNEQGIALANDINQDAYSQIELVGFLDSRSASRLDLVGPHRLIDKLDHIARVVKTNHIQVIYLSLPMASQPRILHVLDELKDTTASIYFVPDMFVTDLIQGRPDSVASTSVISVCETPFKGSAGAIKRSTDVVLSIGILALIFPLLVCIAIAIKRGSPGPVIFKQRRYGLDGGEIVVYKFRTMTVTEDGSEVVQAQKNDARITPLGAILRRTSLDELPQFFNVLQGRMSIVGPRPHAVVHNEMYRKLIKGYMVRHKVRPGITGWAQVHGLRGETDTLEKMQKRIHFDLEYLRNWSPRLDLYVILRTFRLIVSDQKAY